MEKELMSMETVALVTAICTLITSVANWFTSRNTNKELKTDSKVKAMQLKGIQNLVDELKQNQKLDKALADIVTLQDVIAEKKTVVKTIPGK